MTDNFSDLRHSKAGVAALRYVYRCADGDPVLVANRYHKADGSKFFLPFDVTQGIWKAPERRPLYNLDRIVRADPCAPVIWVEGEKCADVLSDLGYLATTTFGGCHALKKADLAPLKGRDVILWPDHDAPGQSYVDQAAVTLRKDTGALPQVIPISDKLLRKVTDPETGGADAVAPTYPKGWDAADAVASGWDKAQIDRLLSYAAPLDTALAKPAPSTTATKTQSLADIEVWKTPDGEPYATLRRDGHFEHWPIASPSFKRFLAYQHYQAHEKMLAQSALDDLRRTYEGQAIFDGEEHPVFNRIGNLNRNLYVDLGSQDWKAVSINAEGWQVIDHPPARFSRARSMKALPMPAASGGDINLLRPFLNTACEEDFQMLVAWLIGCFHPKGPYPILILNGEQGSAKSTTAHVLRNLVDPANPVARSAPQSEQDLVIAAKHNHVLAFDNLSSIRPMMADAFCRIATGGGFGTRKLHTDSEEMLFSATRPCLLNGIPDLASRPDLADRAIVVTLPVIAPSQRAFEGEFNRALEQVAPRILAGVFDAVSAALANIGAVELPERPRMADFAKWVTAASPALGWPEGAFLAAYSANRETSDRATVEGNPVGLSILKLAKHRIRWSGTMTELKTTLRDSYPQFTDDPYTFPRQENKLSTAIRRVIPPLRRMGVEITFARQGASGERVIRIERS